MVALPKAPRRADRTLAFEIVAAAQAHVAARQVVEPREPGSQPRDLPRPTLPASVAADVERIRQAEQRRAAKAARQSKGMVR